MGRPSFRTLRGQTELHQELRRDALLVPGAIGRRHFRDQTLEFSGNPRTTAATGLPPPEQPQRVPMPVKERVGLDDRQ